MSKKLSPTSPKNIDLAVSSILSNKTGTLNKLLNMGLNPNSKTHEGLSLLHLAVLTNNDKITHSLLKHGANPDITSPMQFNFQVRSRYTELSNELFSIKNLTPLMTSALMPTENNTSKSKLNIVDSLIEHKADVNFSEKQYNLTPMHLAANNNDTKILTALIKSGANINSLAFKEHVKSTLDGNAQPLTPLSLAINPLNPKNSSDSIKLLLDSGAKNRLNLSDPFQSAMLLDTLSFNHPKEAMNLLQSNLEKDFASMKYEVIQNKIQNFLTSDTKKEILERSVESILKKGAISNKQYSDIKYLSHLNSWNGVVPGVFDKNHNIEGAQGWLTFHQVPTKIKNLLQYLDKLENSNINFEKTFGEPKETLAQKVKDEIWNQTTTYFSDVHTFTANSLESKQLKQLATTSELKKWCDEIASLKPGQAFAISAGTNDHSVYIDFKKQNDGNISRSIYNLGGASDLHLTNSEGRQFPHVQKDIPTHLFKEHDYDTMNYLKSIIDAANSPCYDERTKKISEPFKAVYEDAELVGGKSANEKDLADYIPMKGQVSGNCSVKNNLCAIRNRFQNDQLYNSVKQFEIQSLRKSINVPEQLYKIKELEKDVASIKFIISSNGNSLASTENDLYRFFGKRANGLSDKLSAKPGDRIADAINKQSIPDNLNYYISQAPRLISVLAEVAKDTNSKELNKVVRSFGMQFEVSKPKKIDMTDVSIDVKPSIKIKRDLSGSNDVAINDAAPSHKRKRESDDLKDKMLNKKSKPSDKNI